MRGDMTNLAGVLPSLDRIREEKAKLESAGVKYIFSCWIDMLGVPKTKPVPLSNFEALCLGKGPQFAVHSVSFFPELGPADSDQIVGPILRLDVRRPVVGRRALQSLSPTRPEAHRS
jgi:glutamine synthetase